MGDFAMPELPVRIGEFFAQNHREFREMCAHIPHNAERILEIGSRYGESLKRLAYCIAPGPKTRIVSVDLGEDPFSPGKECTRWLQDAIKSLHGYEVYVIKGDSHRLDIARQVKQLGPYDFAFIDGDHTPEGVLTDWKTYGPMSKIVAFHDIRLKGVQSTWDCIKSGKEGQIERYVEISYGRETMGIGIVWCST